MAKQIDYLDANSKKVALNRMRASVAAMNNGPVRVVFADLRRGLMANKHSQMAQTTEASTHAILNMKRSLSLPYPLARPMGQLV